MACVQLKGLCRLDGLMVENHELVGPKRCRGVCLPVVVAELDLEHVFVKDFDDSADLTPYQPAVVQVQDKGDDIQKLNCSVHVIHPHAYRT